VGRRAQLAASVRTALGAARQTSSA